MHSSLKDHLWPQGMPKTKLGTVSHNMQMYAYAMKRHQLSVSLNHIINFVII